MLGADASRRMREFTGSVKYLVSGTVSMMSCRGGGGCGYEVAGGGVRLLVVEGRHSTWSSEKLEHSNQSFCFQGQLNCRNRMLRLHVSRGTVVHSVVVESQSNHWQAFLYLPFFGEECSGVGYKASDYEGVLCQSTIQTYSAYSPKGKRVDPFLLPFLLASFSSEPVKMAGCRACVAKEQDETKEMYISALLVSVASLKNGAADLLRPHRQGKAGQGGTGLNR